MADAATEAMNKSIYAEEVAKGLLSMLTVKVTVPLGNLNFKELHTNSFIYCDLSQYFDLENYYMMVSQIESKYGFTRQVSYERDRWYVESCTINNDGSKFTADLELNPFPASLLEYSEEYGKFVDKYIEDTKTNTGGAVASTGNTTLKGGQGTTIDNLVKDIVGNTTDALEKCKKIHEWLRKNVVYAYYECSRYGKDPVKCYNNRSHLNCADTANLTCAMMLSAGLNAYVVQRTYDGGHFWTIIEIGGKKYASDQTGRDTASMSGSAFNTVWKRSGRTTVSNGGAYSKKCGSKSCC